MQNLGDSFMTIKVKNCEKDGELHIKFTGSLTFSEWEEFKTVCLQHGVYSTIYLDIRQIDFIDLAGWGMLRLLSNRFEYADVILLPCNPLIREFLSVLDVSDWFKTPNDCSAQPGKFGCLRDCSNYSKSKLCSTTVVEIN
jgi:anti-anti-sigma regulatory factor